MGIYFPKVLAMPKGNRTDIKHKSRPGLVDPYALYQICVLLYVCSAIYETRTYGAMRGTGGVIPYIYSIKILIHYNTFTKRSMSTETPTEKVRPVVIAELQ